MLHYPLTLKDFEIVEEISLEDLLNTDDEGDIGYNIEVDLDYPDDLYDKHSDFPFISDKEPVDHIELSEYQSELKTALNVSNSKIKKKTETDVSLKNELCHSLPEAKVFHMEWNKSQQVTSRSQTLSVEMARNLHSTEHQQTSA